MNGSFMKQSNKLGSWFGSLKLLSQQAGAYIQIATLAFAMTGAYTGLRSIGIEIPFWAFIMALVVGVVAVLSFEWIMGMPSTFQAWNEQWWNHGNKMREYLETRDKIMDEKLEELRKEIADNRCPKVHSQENTKGADVSVTLSDGSDGPDSSL